MASPRRPNVNAVGPRRRVPFLLIFLIVLLPAFIYGGESVSLSPETFDSVTSGKSVFIKFYAPWCSHSQELAPTWDRLGKEFSTHDSVGLIAEVDCTQHEDWCVRLGITGFPTLLHGDPSQGGIFLEEYTSLQRAFEDLLAFAEKNLTTQTCSPGNIQACDAETQEKLYSYWNMSDAELQSTIAAREEKIRRAEDSFRDQTQTLQQRYDDMARRHELLSARLKRRVRLLKELEEVIENS